jgi:hypothetical protein
MKYLWVLLYEAKPEKQGRDVKLLDAIATMEDTIIAKFADDGVYESACVWQY